MRCIYCLGVGLASAERSFHRGGTVFHRLLVRVGRKEELHSPHGLRS